LHRLARVPVDPALVLPLGTAACAAAYGLSLFLDLPLVFPGLVLLLSVVALVPWQRPRLAPGPSLRGALPAFAAIVLVLAVTQYPWNRLGPDGEFRLDPLVPFDTAFHAGLTQELSLGYPPQVPGVSGFPLGYHLGTDLVRAAALRWARVDPFDAISRFDVTLWALALLLALRGVATRLEASPLAVALVPWTLLATDFSFAFFANARAHWWADLLRGNILISLCLSNPVIPALGLTLGALIALSRYRAGEGRGWLALAALAAACVPFFKVFLGAHLLLGLGVAALLGGRRDRTAALAVGTAPLVATLALVLGRGGETVEVALVPLDLVRVTLDGLGMSPVSGYGLALWSALWIVASLGLRVVGIGPAIRELRCGSLEGRTLATVALSAWPLGLAFRVAAREILPDQKLINDAAYLVEQGGPVLWIFAAMALAGLAQRSGRRALVLAVSAALALPSTAQYVVKKRGAESDPIPASMVRAAFALQRVSAPGEVVLQRPRARYPPAPLILTGRRVPYERFTPYLTQFASRADLEQRHTTVYRFFRTRDPDEARRIAASLGARYVCLYGHDRVRFDPTGFWEPLYEEPDARVYRILEPGLGRQE